MVRTFGWNPSVQSELDMAGKKESDCDKIEMLCIQNGTDNAKRTKQQQLNERTPNSASEQAENVMHADGSPTLSTDGGILAVLPQQPFIGAYSCPAQQIAVPLPNFTPLTHPMCGWQQQFMPPVPLPCQCRCQQILQKPYAQPPGAASNWLLRPVNIGGKVYYEPINIGCSGDIISQGMNFQTKHPDDPIPAPVNSFVPATSAPSLPFSQYDAAISVSHFIPPRSASQTPPSNNVKKPASIRSLSEPRASIYTQHNKRRETTPEDPPWVLGNPQPRCGIRGSQSWQNASVVHYATPFRYSVPVEQSSAIAEPYASMHLMNEASERLKAASTYGPIANSETTVTTTTTFNSIDPAEQHKRDLLQQIEDNKRRKEEERQKELEIERKEQAKFEEYRRKLQRELEEEERRTREKALAAERNAARIHALQMQRKTTDKHGRRRSTGPQQQQHEQSSSRASSKEWWERKEHIGNNDSRSNQSPVIPALGNQKRLRPRDEDGLSQEERDVGRNTRMSMQSRSSSRLERRRHEATAPSRRHNESNSDRARSQDSSYNDVERGASLRSRNNDYDSNGGRGGDIGPCDLEREAAASRSSIVVRRSSRSRRPPSTTESTRSRVEWWEKKRGYDVDHQQARQSPVIPALRNRMNAAGDASSETRNNRDTDTSDNNERSVETRRSRSSPRYQPSASSQRVRSRGASSHGMQTRDSLRGY